jgi:hypothetical protein
MRLKRFNARRFSPRSDRAITILPQAAHRDLAKKAPPHGAPFVSHAVPRAVKKPHRKNKTHSE